MDRLVSKIIAGGLSAGVFLFWWPEHVAGEGLLQLVLRGLLWTLTFELLLLSLAPAEKLAGRRLRRRALARGARVKSRLADVPAPARTGGVVALACCGLAAPLALIADAPTQLVRHVEGPQVVKQVIVERPVIEKKVVVRKVVAPAPQLLQATGAAPSVATSQVSRPVARQGRDRRPRAHLRAQRHEDVAAAPPDVGRDRHDDDGDVVDRHAGHRHAGRRDARGAGAGSGPRVVARAASARRAAPARTPPRRSRR